MSDRIFRGILLAMTALVALLFVLIGWSVAHHQARSKFFGPTAVSAVNANTVCARLPPTPSSEVCFAASMVDSAPWSSGGTTWRAQRSLVVGDCVSIATSEDDYQEVRSVRWAGEPTC